MDENNPDISGNIDSSIVRIFVEQAFEKEEGGISKTKEILLQLDFDFGSNRRRFECKEIFRA